MHPKYTVWTKAGIDYAWKWFMSATVMSIAKNAFDTTVELHPREKYPQYRAVLCCGERSDRRVPYRLEPEEIIETYPTDLTL